MNPNPGQPTPEQQVIIDDQVHDLDRVQRSWNDAFAAVPPRIRNDRLYQEQSDLLDHVRDSVKAQQPGLAVLQLVAFELVVGSQREKVIDADYKREVIHQTTDLRIKLERLYAGRPSIMGCAHMVLPSAAISMNMQVKK